MAWRSVFLLIVVAIVSQAVNSSAYTGDGTYYNVGMGACGRVNSDSELVAAVSTTVYGRYANPNNAAICGQCALVQHGHRKRVKVTIVDKCMGCKSDDIDLSPTAFAQLADHALGRIPVSWRIVPC
ncbi:hypothetical protein BV898_10776 [Hypsibius exemplaris]|uniref:RlpA-like protein double-psi beta-barrel domain-containing protein n=1 Tax=Hypsibius exemplaris TaxID=2072580 RepID=A0A1W0WIK3_HYPEX|nr:hypothetical protein BV898_10776 [Hypsibius exemplaris]